MEPKKTAHADLERKKTGLTLLGLVVALSLVLFAFEWKSYDKVENDLLQRQAVNVEEEDIFITRQEFTPPPPPPPPTQTTLLEIVEDDQEVEDNAKFDAEADQKTVVEEYVPVVVEEVEEKVEELEIFTIVEDMPAFPGGDEARLKYLSENIKYPQMAKESGISGTVYVTFVVNQDGKIVDVKVLRGIGGGCDEEAIRVIKGMPKWSAGKQRGKAVRVQFNMPIRFTLN
ncbi:MAG: energy transducer TonB [Bacteroidetes bacterium]|nr:energy transducer TonB [Bacteroidota bacterium]MBU1719345.1 energy transducer TonB [Bacteroidota bacterium]